MIHLKFFRRFSFGLSARSGLALFGGAALALSCNQAGAGIEPPTNQIYFPVALALEPQEGKWLYVVNSNFDLQFNQGTVQSLDVSRLREVARRPCSQDEHCESGQVCDNSPSEENGGEASFFCVDSAGAQAGKPCGPWEEKNPSDRVTTPGRCGAVSLEDPADGGPSLLIDAVSTAAFATDAVLISRPEEEAEGGAPLRLFVPIRGDASLHFIDSDEEGRFQCGQSEFGGSCSEDYQVQEAPTQDPEEPLRVPSEPYGIAASPDGRHVMIAHQTAGRASAYVNDWQSKPRLSYVMEDLPTAPMGATYVPAPQSWASPERASSHFLLSFRNNANLRLLRFFEVDSEEEYGPHGFIYSEGEALISTNVNGLDSRGILLDDSLRREAEEQCGEDEECLKEAARIPVEVYVANRSPNSLIVGQTRQVDADNPMQALPTFHDTIPLTQGPSRVIRGYVVNQEGERVRRIFVLCFDSAVIYVIDPVRRRVESEIFTGRGPHSLVFDPHPNYPLAYVGHFTDSYLGVLHLDQRFPHTFGAMVATIGTPTPPRASK